MKKLTLILFLLIAANGISAQTGKLPANIAKWEDSHKILNNSAIKSRLLKLLGRKNYANFLESWETVNPIVRKGNFLFSSGCLIHACGHIEAAVAIDLQSKTIHAAIFRDGEKTRYFNERKRKTPQSIKNWARRLEELKK
jgi:hypothetical protein